LSLVDTLRTNFIFLGVTLNDFQQTLKDTKIVWVSIYWITLLNTEPKTLEWPLNVTLGYQQSCQNSPSVWIQQQNLLLTQDFRSLH